MVKVYGFKRQDVSTGVWVTSTVLATQTYIDTLGGAVVIQSSAMEVSPMTLDRKGRYFLSNPLAEAKRAPSVE